MADIPIKFYKSVVRSQKFNPSNPPDLEDPAPVVNPPGTVPTTLYKLLGDVTDSSFVGKNGFVPVVVGENVLTLQSLTTNVLATPLTGYTVGANTAITSLNTILTAFQQVQGQINAGVSGTIASGQVAFGTGVNTIGGDSGLTWDNANKILTISNSTQTGLVVRSSSTECRIIAESNTTTPNAGFQFNANSVRKWSMAAYGTGFNWSLFNNALNQSSIIVLSSNHNVGLGANNTSPTNTLDVNGTTRIRTIANGTGDFLTKSATGVITARTASEVRTDIGAQATISGTLTDTYVATIVAGVPTWAAPSAGSSNWTVVGSDIYRNSAVAIGRTTIPTNATLAVQSLTATSSHTFINLLNNAGSSLLTISQGGEFRYGVSGTFSSLSGVGFKTTANSDGTFGFLVINSSNTSVFSVGNGGGMRTYSSIVALNNPTTNSNSYFTYKASISTEASVIRLIDSTNAIKFDLFANGAIRTYSPKFLANNPITNSNNEYCFKGSGTSTLSMFRLLDSSDKILIDILHNGNIVLDTTTGTKIGTATTQKLSFWNKTPIIQPTTAYASSVLSSLGGTTITDTDTFDGYTLKQIVAALRGIGLLS